jgi:hypothetical protein
LLEHPAAAGDRAADLLEHPAAAGDRAADLLEHPPAAGDRAGLFGRAAAARDRTGLLAHSAAAERRGTLDRSLAGLTPVVARPFSPSVFPVGMVLLVVVAVV